MKARQVLCRLSMAVLLFLGCLATTGPVYAAPVTSAPLEQRTSLGEVHLTLTVDRPQLGVTDTVRVTLTAEAPTDMTLTFPDVPPTLGPFKVVQHRTPAPLPLTPQTQQWQREYLLAPDTAGTLTLPPLTVQIPATAAASSAPPQTLITAPVSLTVTTVLPAEADVTVLKDIAPPATLVPRVLPAWGWLGLVALGGLDLLAHAWWYARRQRYAPPPVVHQPAHVLALAALARLQHPDPSDARRCEAFYVRLSDIVRRYIELRFGLGAPEQTTEEFLTTVVRTGGLLVTHRDALDAFLQHCDLVKFARFQPTPDDMQQALASATRFVEHTADAAIVVTVPRTGEPVL